MIFAKTSWKAFDQQFAQQLTKFRDHRRAVEREADIAHMSEEAESRALVRLRMLELEKQKEGSSGPHIQTEHDSNIILETMRQKLLDMFPKVDYRNKHRRLQKLRHEGTCDWISDAAAYQDWVAACKSTCLRCHGIRRTPQFPLAILSTLS